MSRRAADKYHWQFPEGESYADGDVRAAASLRVVAAAGVARPLVVSHEMIGRMLLRNLLDVTPMEALAYGHPHDVIYRVDVAGKVLHEIHRVMTVVGNAEPGTVIVLNGTPRSGKSTVARALQESLDGIWINLGVDVFAEVIPEGLRPGIGLRPGGERPDLEDAVVALFDALLRVGRRLQPIRAQCGGRRRASRRLLKAVGDPDEGRPRALCAAGLFRRRALPRGGDHGAPGCERGWSLRHERS